MAKVKSTANGGRKVCTAISYNCGAICLSINKVCRKGGASIDKARLEKLATIAGKATEGKVKPKKAESKTKPNGTGSKELGLVEQLQNTDVKFYDRKELAKKGKFLGEGITASVYAVDGIAHKQLSTGTIFDETIRDTKILSDLGVSPKLLGVSPDRTVLAMEQLKGYSDGPAAEASTVKEAMPFYKNLFKAVRKVHDAGYSLTDLHEENMMSNPKTKDVKLIDVGVNRDPKAIAVQLLDPRASERPLMAQITELLVKESAGKDKKPIQQLKKMQKQLDLLRERETDGEDAWTGKKWKATTKSEDYQALVKDLYGFMSKYIDN